jgi:hypothetical protein
MRGLHVSRVLLLASPLFLLGRFFLYTSWDPAVCRGNKCACVLSGFFWFSSVILGKTLPQGALSEPRSDRRAGRKSSVTLHPYKRKYLPYTSVISISYRIFFPNRF